MADLIAIPGAVDANSYVTVAEADAYFDARVESETWDENPAEQVSALITATHVLDDLRFRGRRASHAQALQFPRAGARDRDGHPLADDLVPAEVKRAQMEIALRLLEDGMPGTGGDALESVTVGPVTIRPEVRRETSVPTHVSRALSHLLLSAPGNVRLSRA